MVVVNHRLGINGERASGTYSIDGVTYQQTSQGYQPVSYQEWGIVKGQITLISYEANTEGGKSLPGTCQLMDGSIWRQDPAGKWNQVSGREIAG